MSLAARPRGSKAARPCVAVVHQHALYDEEIDTTYDTPQTSAAKIFGFLESGLTPSAFARLRERFARGS